MARKPKDTESPARRRRKNTKTSLPRVAPKKKSSPVITIMAVLAVMVLAWATLVKDDGSVPSSKIAPAIIGVLDQVYLGCTVYWFNQGSHLPCGQEIIGKLHDSKNSEIKITIINNLRKEFSVTGKHIADRMVFRIDAEGDIFLKAKECETNIEALNIPELNFDELEAQCKPK
ncbi:MAG: hypothetical protein HOL15_06750 [Nitrospinaceae bacterium]|nr:hypothetical protein [Nitrospinaceae bacterium]